MDETRPGRASACLRGMLLRRWGPAVGTLVLTAAACLLSMLVVLVIDACCRALDLPLSLALAALVPAIAAPPMIFTLCLVLGRLYRTRDELLRRSTTDELTAVASRGHFRALAERELARAARHRHACALLMIDADHFKAINDRYGHAVGDEVLRVLAAVLRDGVRAIDLVGRMGGEEFAVLLPQASGACAGLVAERLRRTVAQCRVATPQGPIGVTVSIGLALGGAPDLDALLHVADAALYRAKALGRNRVEPAEPLAEGAAAPARLAFGDEEA